MGKKKIVIIIGLVIVSLAAGVIIGRMKGSSDKRDIVSQLVVSKGLESEQRTTQPQVNQPFAQVDYVEQIQKILKEKPNDAKALSEVGDIYFSQQKFMDAIAYYKKAINLDPQDIDSYNDMGLAYHYIGKSEDGLKYVEEGIKKNSDYQRIWLTKGFILGVKGNIADARSALEKAYSLNPNTDVGKSAASFLEQYKSAAK